MFTLRIIDKTSEHNIFLGSCYTVIAKHKNLEAFKIEAKGLGLAENVDIIIRYGNTNHYPIIYKRIRDKEIECYIVGENGNTFQRL